MTKAELIAGLRARFEEVNAKHPDLRAEFRRYSDQEVLEANCRCGACRRFHIPVSEVVERAAAARDMEQFIEGIIALEKDRVPLACRRKLDADWSEHQGN